MASTTVVPETAARLRQLDRREWSRLAVSLIIIVLLTAGLGGVTLARVESFVEHPQVEIGLRSLWGAILLFAVFAIYQQTVIMRLRRQMTAQIAMDATLELVAPPTPEVKQGWSVTRKYPRYSVKCRIAVTTTTGGGSTSHGYTTDVSEGGLAVILPEAFAPGTSVMVEMNLGEQLGGLMLPAVVRHRRGYCHGLEFVDATPSAASRLRDLCAGHPLVEARSPMDPSVPAEAPLLSDSASKAS
jgi:PilZ domain